MSYGVTVYQVPEDLTLCGEKVPLERQDVWESMDQVFISAVYNPAQVILWIKRAHRYFPILEKCLKQRGMPDDLKYVAVVESSLRTYAVSPAQARGPWQLMEATAKKYGLRVDKWVDERLHFERATEAALAYLRDLHRRFGNWTLAIAAYNCGENRVTKNTDLQGSQHFYDTDLPLETEAYIFKIIAAKLILSQPGAYGYTVPTRLRYPPLRYEQVYINLPRETSLVTLAKAGGTTFKTLKEMNPELRQDSVPAGPLKIRVPVGGAARIKDALGNSGKN